jgi:hypothetical protein
MHVVHYFDGNFSTRVTHQAVIERRREFLQVEPDIECGVWRDVDIDTESVQTLEDVVTLHLEVSLESQLLLFDVLGVQ